MGLLSWLARKAKVHFFLSRIPPGSRVLEVGCGSQWLRDCVPPAAAIVYESIDLCCPATFQGDVRQWKALGMKANSYDVVIAFEVLEHVECVSALHALLKVGGLLMLTSPVPDMDWLLQLGEHIRLLQRRTSAHTNLRVLDRLEGFQAIYYKARAGVSQWGILIKTTAHT